jgi:membrane protein
MPGTLYNPAIRMRTFWRNFRGALDRVFPDGLSLAQGVAFNMFLAFLPMLLFALALLTSAPRLGIGPEEFVSRLRWLLPPTTRTAVTEHLNQIAAGSGKVMLLGLWGTLMVGTQVMSGLIDGFRVVYRTPERLPFWRQQARALFLLIITIVPFLATVLITVFGRQLRGWMITKFGLPQFFYALWIVVYVGLALIVAALILVLIYRAGRPGCTGWNEVVPGAVVATLLWWVVNSGFGFYVRRVPYSLIYGSLAAAIGLMVWMYLSVVVVFIGAAYNAAALSLPPARRATDPPQAADAPAEDAEPEPAPAPRN